MVLLWYSLSNQRCLVNECTDYLLTKMDPTNTTTGTFLGCTALTRHTTQKITYLHTIHNSRMWLKRTLSQHQLHILQTILSPSPSTIIQTCTNTYATNSFMRIIQPSSATPKATVPTHLLSYRHWIRYHWCLPLKLHLLPILQLSTKIKWQQCNQRYPNQMSTMEVECAANPSAATHRLSKP